MKPDYSGPNVTGVVPALLGVRPVEWMPAPVAGARATVLLVLDGLGWEALQDFPDQLPELRAFSGGPVSTVVPSTTPAALTSITTGMPPSRHGITGFRIRHERGVLNAIRWQLADGSRAPEPEHVQKERVFCGQAVPVVTKAMFRTTGFTAAHMRGTDFHGWQTTSVLVEEVRAARRRRRAVRLRLLLRASTRSRTRTASSRRSTRPSSAPPTGWWATCSTRCPTTPRSW